MVKEYLKKYFVTAMGAMAQGLFATVNMHILTF